MNISDIFLNIGFILLIEVTFLIILIFIYMKNWSRNEKLIKIIESAHISAEAKKQNKKPKSGKKTLTRK